MKKPTIAISLFSMIAGVMLVPDYRDTPSRSRKTGAHNLKSKYAAGNEPLNDKKTRG
jgi:hypothetical protein